MDVVTSVGAGALYAGLTLATWGAIVATIVGAIMLAYGIFLLVTNGDRTAGMSLVASGTALVIIAWVIRWFLGA